MYQLREIQETTRQYVTDDDDDRAGDQSERLCDDRHIIVSCSESGEEAELLGGLEKSTKRRSPEFDDNVAQHINRRTFPCTTAQIGRKFLYFKPYSCMQMTLQSLSFLRDFRLLYIRRWRQA